MRIVQLTGHHILEDTLDVELCAPFFRNGLPFYYSFLFSWPTVLDIKNRTIAAKLQLTGHGIIDTLDVELCAPNFRIGLPRE